MPSPLWRQGDETVASQHRRRATAAAGSVYAPSALLPVAHADCSFRLHSDKYLRPEDRLLPNRRHVLPDEAGRSFVPPQLEIGTQRALRSASVLQLEHAPVPGLVSVVIPTHNRAPIIGRALESVLAQSYDRIQIVIADDGSSDDTQKLAEAYGARVTYVRQANAGVSAARNLGIRHTRGEFIAFLDSDDSWRPWKIEAQIAALQRHSDAGIVWTDMAAIDDSGRLIGARHLRVMYAAYGKVRIEQILNQVDTLAALSANAPAEVASTPVHKGDLFSAILLGNLIHTSTVLFRRSWLERTGGFDESFARAGEDYEFYIRLCSAGPAVFIDAPSTFYRIGAADQLTRPAMMLEIARNNLRAVEKWLPRSAPDLALSPRAIRRRVSESFGWLGEAELDAGHRWLAARRLSHSLALIPGLDRRALLLARCVLPDMAVNVLRSLREGMFASKNARANVSDPRRFLFLDGLRGVAALMVVVFHLYGNLRPAVQAWFPPLLSTVCLSGNLGVDIFFVISGFVIAHSVRNGERSWRYLGRFGLRRSIRLDPPLWMTILMEVALIKISLSLFPDLGTPLPEWSQILANVTYTQHFLGISDIVPVFWSLTYEVQFYIVLVGALVLLHRVPRSPSLTRPLFVAAFCYSLGVWLGAFPSPVRGLFIDRWFQFALGIAAWAVFMRHISKAQFAALCVVTLCAILAMSPVAYRARSTEVAVLSAVLLALVSLTGRLETMLSGTVIQFLGRVSYSLYLIHLSVGWRFISVFRRKFGPELGPAMGSAAFLGGVLLSVFSAWLVYVTLEAPSMRLARSIRLPLAVKSRESVPGQSNSSSDLLPGISARAPV